MIKALRKYPRYRLPSLLPLQASVDRQRYLQHLIVLGEGGCGFYGTAKDREIDYRIKTGRLSRVYCHFCWPGLQDDPLEVQANVLYCYPQIVANKRVFFYGLEFIRPHKPRIRPIIEKLEKLAMEGKVQID